MYQKLSKDYERKSWNIASFNIRGLNDQINMNNWAQPYLWNLCCLQETKMKNGCDKYVRNYRLTSFIMEVPIIQKNISYWFLSDRDFRMKELIYFPSTNDHYGRCAKTVQIRSFFLFPLDLRIQSQQGKTRTRKNSVFVLFLHITQEYRRLDP